MDLVDQAEAVVLALQEKFICDRCRNPADISERLSYWDNNVCDDCATDINNRQQVEWEDEQWHGQEMNDTHA